MTKLEQIEFENLEKFHLAIGKILAKEEVFRTYKNSEGEEKKKKIIANNRLYIGNNLSLNIVEAENKKVYVCIDYFSVENRFDIAKNKTDSKKGEL